MVPKLNQNHSSFHVIFWLSTAVRMTCYYSNQTVTVWERFDRVPLHWNTLPVCLSSMLAVITSWAQMPRRTDAVCVAGTAVRVRSLKDCSTIRCPEEVRRSLIIHAQITHIQYLTINCRALSWENVGHDLQGLLSW